MSGIVSSLEPDGTLYVWYVARLQGLSSGLPERSVPLESLTDLDENLWFSTYGEVPTCRAVAAHAARIFDADMGHPVLLSPAGEVLDGMHRVAKAWLSGMKEVRAVQFSEMPPPDEVIPEFNAAGGGAS